MRAAGSPVRAMLAAGSPVRTMRPSQCLERLGVWSSGKAGHLARAAATLRMSGLTRKRGPASHRELKVGRAPSPGRYDKGHDYGDASIWRHKEQES
jgi:hypothetical protein